MPPAPFVQREVHLVHPEPARLAPLGALLLQSGFTACRLLPAQDPRAPAPDVALIEVPPEAVRADGGAQLAAPWLAAGARVVLSSTAPWRGGLPAGVQDGLRRPYAPEQARDVLLSALSAPRPAVRAPGPRPSAWAEAGVLPLAPPAPRVPEPAASPVASLTAPPPPAASLTAPHQAPAPGPERPRAVPPPRPLALGKLPELSPAVAQHWKAARQAPEDAAAQERFIEAAVAAGELEQAARHYRALLARHPGAAEVERALNKVGTILGFMALRPERVTDAYGMSTGLKLMLAMFIAGALILSVWAWWMA